MYNPIDSALKRQKTTARNARISCNENLHRKCAVYSPSTSCQRTKFNLIPVTEMSSYSPAVSNLLPRSRPASRCRLQDFDGRTFSSRRTSVNRMAKSIMKYGAGSVRMVNPISRGISFLFLVLGPRCLEFDGREFFLAYLVVE
jgi:hypothetical protein